MEEVKVIRHRDGKLVYARHGRPWTTTVRRVAELKADRLRVLGYEAEAGNDYPFVVYINKTPKQ